MPIDPMILSTLAGEGSSITGAFLEALGGDLSWEQLEEIKRQFDQEMALKQKQLKLSGGDIARQIDMLPIRDKAMYMLEGRMGMTPGAFQPRDIYNQQLGGTGNLGGVDFNALKEHAEGYTYSEPPSGEVLRRLLAMLGLGPSPGAPPSPPPPPPPEGQGGRPGGSTRDWQPTDTFEEWMRQRGGWNG